ncbi:MULTISPECIES: hypothetical protein [unclassified Mesorhizobium]|uniref:hypothetical protein n=1 Tax=unclassified Mesorhizobium TaxID=325217 RepID=UPI000FDB7E01|nr:MULTISPECIES: hypothetical protein [unclassified Mesorhizobium]TGQ04001.1 hypothetical protein EN862_034080 [Mesorhizobium sp. M2E.F.Ca.ET.219.01.1.1]TGT63090.1 hypothetical protein EN809_036570 [Mesorhizobium sp. M2E.F.Ca.ET.166.01.1.1]TGV96760.1 hypothetical protein EN797_036275 [Mesorhizobium sp. M2E.F.Ca.ET.154.01.1.1]
MPHHSRQNRCSSLGRTISSANGLIIEAGAEIGKELAGELARGRIDQTPSQQEGSHKSMESFPRSAEVKSLLVLQRKRRVMAAVRGGVRIGLGSGS